MLWWRSCSKPNFTSVIIIWVHYGSVPQTHGNDTKLSLQLHSKQISFRFRAASVIALFLWVLLDFEATYQLMKCRTHGFSSRFMCCLWLEFVIHVYHYTHQADLCSNTSHADLFVSVFFSYTFRVLVLPVHKIPQILTDKNTFFFFWDNKCCSLSCVILCNLFCVCFTFLK